MKQENKIHIGEWGRNVVRFLQINALKDFVTVTDV